MGVGVLVIDRSVGYLPDSKLGVVSGYLPYSKRNGGSAEPPPCVDMYKGFSVWSFLLLGVGAGVLLTVW